MRILYDKEKGLVIHFKAPELKFGLGVLRGINKVAPQDFIDNAMAEIEKDMQPILLPIVSHFHFCHRCACEIDDRDGDNFVHFMSDDRDYFRHKTCPQLKSGRPV